MVKGRMTIKMGLSCIDGGSPEAGSNPWASPAPLITTNCSTSSLFNTWPSPVSPSNSVLHCIISMSVYGVMSTCEKDLRLELMGSYMVTAGVTQTHTHTKSQIKADDAVIDDTSTDEAAIGPRASSPAHKDPLFVRIVVVQFAPCPSRSPQSTSIPPSCFYKPEDRLLLRSHLCRLGLRLGLSRRRNPHLRHPLCHLAPQILPKQAQSMVLCRSNVCVQSSFPLHRLERPRGDADLKRSLQDLRAQVFHLHIGLEHSFRLLARVGHVVAGLQLGSVVQTSLGTLKSDRCQGGSGLSRVRRRARCTDVGASCA